MSAIVVRDSASGETVALHAFVMVPRPAGTTIDGFRVGRYEPRALRGDPGYARPRGLVEVTEANRGTFVAPHFTLGQFVSKQAGGYPKYLVLRERLLLKLEMLLEEAARAGLPVTTFQDHERVSHARTTTGPSATRPATAGTCTATPPTSTWTRTATASWTT